MIGGEFYYIHLFNFAFQSLLCVFFFRRVQPSQPLPRWRKGLAYASLLLLLPLFLSVELNLTYNFWTTCGRFFYRALVYVVYLRLGKKSGWGPSIYASLLFTSIYTACQAFFQVPMLFEEPYLFWNNLLRNLLYLPAFLLSYFLLPAEHFSRITKERAVTMGIVVICLLYTKNSLFSLNYNGELSPEYLSVALILLHFFLLAFLIAFERYAYSTRQLEQSRVQDIVNGYRMRNMKAHEASEADLRALHHDMKNHLLMIQEMARMGGENQILEYTAQLLVQSSGYEKRVQTGNELLDGLLSEKAQEAELEQIHVTIAMDFRPASYVEDADLCTIFGNAMDNAIEACRKVKPPEARFLSVKSNLAADCLFVTVQNQHAEELRFYDGMPVTTKAQASLHGFGLQNIRRTLAKYQGMLSIDAGADHCFTLTLIFPLHGGDGGAG